MVPILLWSEPEPLPGILVCNCSGPKDTHYRHGSALERLNVAPATQVPKL